ncbi:SpsE Sialic acid synthase [Burkholderiales bacterium]|jgi:N-acetylneuraminate synthase
MDLNQRWIIAEIGSVHDGSLGNAQKLIQAAAEAGASCVKFQTHIADAETLADAPSPKYFSAEPRKQYFERTSFAPQQWRILSETARSEGVTFLSSPFAIEAVEILEDVSVSAYKIPSGEITNLPLLRRVAETGKPVLLSTGMSTWLELSAARKIFETEAKVCLMQCTSIYPCPPELVGLNNLFEIRTRFPGTTVGFSDHTLGFAAGVAAATLGATVIEKHFTFSRRMYGSDAKNSLEPDEFKLFTAAIREAWMISSSPVDKDSLALDTLSDTKQIFQKSLVSAYALPRGTLLNETHFSCKKPGDGISPECIRELVGRRLRQNVKSDHKFTWGDFE